MINKIRLFGSNPKTRFYRYVDNEEIELTESNGVWTIYFEDDTEVTCNSMEEAINIIENQEK